MRFSERLKPLLTICFIGAPTLFLISALFEGLVKDDMFTQGVIGQYGGIMFTGVNITLALIIARKRQALGLYSLLIGVVGGVASAAGYMVMYSYEIASALYDFSGRELMIELTSSPDPKMFIGGVIGLFVPLSLIFNGVALLVTKVTPRGSGIFLILAGLGFFVGQGVFAVSVVISPVFMALALIPIWFHNLRSADWLSS